MDNKFIFNFLQKKEFFPSKKLGQNFLIDDNTKRKIVASIEIKDSDYIFEIGPGLGSLTDYILEETQSLSLIELDKRLADILRTKYPQLNLINDDCLKVNYRSLFKEIRKSNIKIVSNLPYSVSSLIIIKLIKFTSISKMVLMVQKEMGERVCAKFGDSNYNHFSIIVNSLWNVKKVFDVPNGSFIPQPQVESSVITFEPKAHNFENIEEFHIFLKRCFAQKRKTLFNNLKPFYTPERINDVLKKNNLQLNIRPQQISERTFYFLYEGFKSE